MTTVQNHFLYQLSRGSCLALGLSLGMTTAAFAAGTAASAVPAAPALAASADEPPQVLRFAIERFVVDGARLLTQTEFDQALVQYTGKQRDFSDVQHALEAVEELYAQHGYSAVHVLLPEQELEQGTVHFQVIEGRYGKVVVKNNKFVSEQNVLSALPSVRSGGVPRARQVARELKVANENPARQLNVVLKGGEQDDLVDASVLVTDNKPGMWSVVLDNSGSKETGQSRLGLSYRHANLFDADHVGQVQMQLSPQHMDRLRVFGGSYKIPMYQDGRSVEFFVGYSNVNSVVGGVSNFQGGGTLFSSRYNVPLDRWGSFDPRLVFGLDWRKFSKIELTNPPPTTLYNDIVVTPLSVAYASQGRVGKGDVNFNAAYTLNVPAMSQGKPENFANYDLVNQSDPTPRYRVVHYGAGYLVSFAEDWQFRTALNGQWSGDSLIQGEQMRLGGADGVRGFSEGSETGEIGARMNVELYAPSFELGEGQLRPLVFVDGGRVQSRAGANTTSITSAGLGLRSMYGAQYSLRMDAGRIIKAGNDPQQLSGDWRIHAALSATF